MSEAQDINPYEILTPQGFKPFVSIIKSIQTTGITITLEDSREISVTLDHKFKHLDSYKEAKYFKVNDELQGSKIIKIENIEGEFYEPLEVRDHEYIANDFINHNCNIIVVDECLEYDTIINVYSETLNESFDIKIGDFYNLVDLRSNIINKFTNFAKPTNYDLLEKYVDFCLFKQTNKIKGSTESHHILPKNTECFPQYSKSKWNLVNLTFRDHFIAHSMLAECYPDINKILLAWYMMANKNSKTKVRNLNKVIDANTYEKLKKESIKKISYINSQIVSVKKNGKWLKVSKEEYHNNKKIYETPGLNKIYCENITTGEKMWLDKVDYDPKIYKTHNSNMCVMVNVITKQVERISKGVRTADHMGLNKFIVVCRNSIHITIQAKYIENNDIYITDCKQMIKNIKLLSILIRKHLGMRKKCEKIAGTVTCFDVEQNIFKRIPKKIFDANRDRYLGTTNKKIKEYI
ncbi:MobE homing endonuclease [Campylobacter phage vB_CcoM-IBB_35]|uniref:MobE homing endonuclease n=1 Tax=Campylobacter virus IBB35 TaxID=1006972 RepID=H6SUG1_9CAUD|nr:homing endonuclease [Campylobacter phage vB_CcoM-IBB_35]AEI88227.1 MobE homing endonuclease [Campylobacter phage vB_CcoM-IBB_35]